MSNQLSCAFVRGLDSCDQENECFDKIGEEAAGGNTALRRYLRFWFGFAESIPRNEERPSLPITLALSIQNYLSLKTETVSRRHSRHRVLCSPPLRKIVFEKTDRKPPSWWKICEAANMEVMFGLQLFDWFKTWVKGADIYVMVVETWATIQNNRTLLTIQPHQICQVWPQKMLSFLPRSSIAQTTTSMTEN